MKATQKVMALGLSAALCVEALGGGAHVAPASPPPCTVDGACYPKHNTWGYYGQRWRTWPGVELSAAKPERPETSVLGDKPFEAPRPEEEERQAPPPLESSKPESEEAAGEPPANTPPLNLPPLPLQTPPAAVPQENGQTAPPPLPFEQPMQPTTPPPALRPLPGTEPPPGNPPRPTEVPLSPPGASFPQGGSLRPVAPREADVPPAMPLHLTKRSLEAPVVSGQSSITIRRLPSVPAVQPASRVVTAGAAMKPGVQPRALPAVYTPSADLPPALPAFRQ